MKHYPIRLFAAATMMAAFVAVTSGCSAVYSSGPVGSKPSLLKPADWDGVWATDEGAAHIRVEDAAAGRLQVNAVDIKDGKPVLETSTYLIREVGDSSVVSTELDRDIPGQYVWVRIRRSDDIVLVWWPDPKKVRDLVQAGKLRGRIDKGDVYLDPNSDNDLLQLITNEPESVFDSAGPVVLRRVFRARGQTNEKA